MQFLHSASAMADTNMKKKDFARRTRKIRRAKRRRENPLFRRTKQHFRRAITCRHLLFCATNKIIRRTKFRRAYTIRRRAKCNFRRANKTISSRKNAPLLNFTRRRHFRRAKTHLHIGAKNKFPSFSYATVDFFVALSCLLRRKLSSRKIFLPP